MLNKLRTHIDKVLPLSDTEFERIVPFFKVQHARKNAFLIQEGELARNHYFVVNGLLKLVFTDADGKAHIVGFAMEDWWESDFEAFYTGKPATMSLQCIEDSTLLAISLADYNALLLAVPALAHFFLEKAYFGFIASQRRVLSSLTSNTQERFQQLVQRYPALLQRVPKAQLAAYLGVSRETLSRIDL